MASSTAVSASTLHRVPLSAVLNGLQLQDDKKSAVENYLKKYSCPTACKQYPSWFCFRIKEVVLNVLGLFFKRIQSEGRKVDNSIFDSLDDRVKVYPDLQVEKITVSQGQAEIRVSSELFNKMGQVIQGRTNQITYHVLKQLRSTAKNDAEGVTVKVHLNCTYAYLLDVLAADKQALVSGEEVHIKFRNWP